MLAAKLVSGVTPEDIAQRVAITTPTDTGEPARSNVGRIAFKAHIVHDEIPEGLIDLIAAAEKYPIPVGRITNWVHRGHIQLGAGGHLGQRSGFDHPSGITHL